MTITWLSVGLLILSSLALLTKAIDLNGQYVQSKVAGFTDPNIGYVYGVASYNVTSMPTGANHRSIIRVTRRKIVPRVKFSALETIQTLPFHSTLVDFDLHCQPTHCYLVTVTSRSRQNVELYGWRRTQFDLLDRMDSFARPYAVKLFKIQSSFYVAIAQQQAHLSPNRLALDYEETPRFVGCAILKFNKGHESDTKYHQFIRLPFEPLHVDFYVSVNSNNITSTLSNRLQENHYLVFSVAPNWPETLESYTFVWSSLNDYFWPYKLPRGVVLGPTPPGAQYPILRFQSEQQPNLNAPQQTMNLTQQVPYYQDKVGPIEMCFSQLQRLLFEREVQSRKLIDLGRSIWRVEPPGLNNNITSISTQVIVRGNVIVKGSVIESPQISLIGGRNQTITINQIESNINPYSPSIVDGKLRQATYKLRHVRDKLSRAVTLSSEGNITFGETITQFDSPIKFFGPISAKKVIFSNGIANSNVKLNGVSFKQLEYELVNLRGNQDIAATVKFTGTVTADLLEIHGRINERYYLKDAFDINSQHLQVVEQLIPIGLPVAPPMTFSSIITSELGLSHNATFNDVRLIDFITKDNRTQLIVGRKTFKQLTIGKLSLAHPNILLNGYNLGQIATNSIYLINPTNEAQFFNGRQLTFSKPIRANRLVINGLINRHINISSLLYDSVKTFDPNPQMISGFKTFLRKLKIRHLTTEGDMNGVLISQLFNLNLAPPVPEYLNYQNQLLMDRPPITGHFVFAGPVFAEGHLNAQLLNGIDMIEGAVRRRFPPPLNPINGSIILDQPQIITGRKIFNRPIQVNRFKLLPAEQINQSVYPLVNGLDIRLIKMGLQSQKQNPSLVYIDNLEIDGNLNLNTNWNNTGPSRTTFGNFSVCRLDAIRSTLITTGAEDQFINVPVRISSMRGKSILLDPNALNGFSFPNDFVLKSKPTQPSAPDQIEPVFGHKTFDQLAITPSLDPHPAPFNNQFGPKFILDVPRSGYKSNILFGHRSSINNITHNELETFIMHERQKNSTGETVLQTLTVHGQILAKKINGYLWPEDIILKSIGANTGPVPRQLHRRIYSPLIFTESVNLNVENQLVLRGPIQLSGRLNEVNLTEFARQSATYGDKDLMTVARPLQNKVFMGGITVTGDISSRGLIDDINFDELKNRVVTITPRRGQNPIVSHKIFMSDVIFQAPLRISHLNDLPIDVYLNRAQVQQDGDIVRIRRKKTITGTLKINKNLIVTGLINNIDFADLKARAISLSPANNRIEFNKTLTIEGNAFMDNLWIDEKDGIIDGVRLNNMLPIQGLNTRDYIVKQPVISKRNQTIGGFDLTGFVHDCNIVCSLNQHLPNITNFQQPAPLPQILHSPIKPPPFEAQPDAPYPARQINYNGKNITFMRTTPPYSNHYRAYSPPPVKRYVAKPNYTRNIQNLALRRPMAIQYEKPTVVKRFNTSVVKSSVVKEQLVLLRKEIISLNLIQSVTRNNIVVGFIEAPSISVRGLLWSKERPSSYGHLALQSFLQLDQIDFSFRPSRYHLSVGVSTNSYRSNVTKVVSSVGESELRILSVLPVESPNSAMFLKLAEQQILFLFVSQDYTMNVNINQGPQCPRNINYQPTSLAEYDHKASDYRRLGGVHVYLFHALEKSSSLESAYFDLYQTIDLPGVDSFEQFEFRGSIYALAASRASNKVSLLLLRGYSGFQVVSYFHIPMLEGIRVARTPDGLPALVIYRSNGLQMVMEPVII